MKKLGILLLSLLFATPSFATTLYLKSAGGNWSAAATWSNVNAAGVDSSGPPTAADDVILELASGAVTIDTGSTRVCRSLNTTSGTGNYTGTITQSVQLNIGDGTAGAGNVALKLNSGMTYTNASSTVSFISTSATQQTIDFGTLSPGGSVTINGAGSSYQLTSDLSIGANGAWTYSGGTTFDANGKNITLTANSALFSGGGKTYFGLIMTYNGAGLITGANTFTNLSRTGIANKTQQIILSSDQTVTGTLTLAGNSSVNRLLVTSNTRCTARTITKTGATMTWSNVDFEDIALTTSFNASAITGLSGDCGGNSNITFTTGTNQYFKTGASANWSSVSGWFLGTNGTGGGGHVPLPQDTGIFDASSITAGSVVITQDMPRLSSVNWTGVTNTPTWTTSTVCTVYGSITMVAGMTLTASTEAYTFAGRSAYSLTSGGLSFAKAITIDAPSGTLTIADAFNSTSTITLTYGGINVSNVNFTATTFSSSNSNPRVITVGSGTWAFTGGGSGTTIVWNTSNNSGLTMNRGTAITFTYSGGTATRRWDNGGTGGSTIARTPDWSITAGSDTIQMNRSSTNMYVNNLDFTGFTGTTTNDGTAADLFIYGNVTVASGMTLTNGASGWTFGATSGTQTITSNGKALPFPITFNGAGGTFSLADAMTVAEDRTTTLTAGDFKTNNNAFSTGKFSSSLSGARGLGLGSSTFTLTGFGAIWTTTTTTGLAFTPSTSTIKSTSAITITTDTFAGGGLTFNNLWFSKGSNTGSITIVGNNTFSNFKDDGAAAHSILFTAGSTQTVSTFTVSGTAGNEITINSTTTATHTLTKTGGGTISRDYLNIQHSAATPSSTWYAGTHSTNNQAAATAGSGWIFTDAPSGILDAIRVI